MKNLIQEIRNKLGYSQQQLAERLGVSPISISRWENEKAKPSALAEKMLFEMCKGQQLDLSEFLVDQERVKGDGLILYHASRDGIKGSIKPSSRSKCDFGKGFYMGDNPLQPLTLVCNEECPVFYALSFDTTDLKVLNVEPGLDWAMLIAFYRGYMDEAKGSSFYEKYAHKADGADAIFGCIADDRMYQVLTDFFEQRITDAALLGSLSALDLGKQYVAVTQKACDKISILAKRELSKLELMILKEKSIMRRKEGLMVADRMVKEHRRDGRYFDEILKEGRL